MELSLDTVLDVDGRDSESSAGLIKGEALTVVGNLKTNQRFEQLEHFQKELRLVLDPDRFLSNERQIRHNDAGIVCPYIFLEVAILFESK